MKPVIDAWTEASREMVRALREGDTERFAALARERESVLDEVEHLATEGLLDADERESLLETERTLQAEVVQVSERERSAVAQVTARARGARAYQTLQRAHRDE